MQVERENRLSPVVNIPLVFAVIYCQKMTLHFQYEVGSTVLASSLMFFFFFGCQPSTGTAVQILPSPRAIPWASAPANPVRTTASVNPQEPAMSASVLDPTQAVTVTNVSLFYGTKSQCTLYFSDGLLICLISFNFDISFSFIFNQ